MAACAHGHVFCLGIKFFALYKKLDTMQKKVPNFDSDSEDGVTMRKAIFEVEPVPLQYTLALGSSQIDFRVKQLSKTSVLVFGCQFWLVGWPWAKLPSRAPHIATRLILSSHARWKNEMINAPRLRAEEVNCRNQFPEPEIKMMLRPEYNSVNLLRIIVCKFTKPADIVWYACCRMQATGQSCLLVQQHRSPMGCERDQSCVPEASHRYQRRLPGSF